MLGHLKNGGSSRTLHFPSTLDASQVIRMKSRLTRLANRPPRLIVIDLRATRQVKLAGLGMLVDRLRRVGNGVSEIRFSNASPRVHQTLVRAGVDELFCS